MNDRQTSRVPLRVRAEYRTPSSFLVAYSVNLSRGGMFLESSEAVELGTRVELDLAVPQLSPLQLVGHVVWVRKEASDGPPGFGIEFSEEAAEVGSVVDQLVAAYSGLSILLLSSDRQDRTSVVRLVKSVFATAEIMQVADTTVASPLITPDLDLAIFDVDANIDGALANIRAAKELVPAVPVVAICATKSTQDAARSAGADEVVSNPPPFAELQLALVRALGRPLTMSTSDRSVTQPG